MKHDKFYLNFIKSSVVVTTAFGLILGAGSVSATGVLNVTNWAEYIGEDTIANFEKEFDIKVVYDNYDSQEAIDSKLLAGSSGYDVVSHSSTPIARLIPAGILQPLDWSKLPNLIGNHCITLWNPAIHNGKRPGMRWGIAQGSGEFLQDTGEFPAKRTMA